MEKVFDIDWTSVLVPSTSLLEVALRGTCVYLGLLVCLRIFRREAGAINMTDLLLIVLIADAAQNAMAHDYKSVPDGVLLVAVIIGWSYALDWLGHKVPAVGRLVHPPPLLLVKDGKVLLRNLRRELITKQELMSQLREQGVEGLAKVKRAYMEGDGKISVVTTDRAQHPAPKKGQT